MATPHVTGGAALVWSKFPNLTVPQVIQRIISGADPPADRQKTTATNTRLNLANAMEDDTVPPAAVNDLSASGILLTRVNLSWTATGDDGLQGNAVEQAQRVKYTQRGLGAEVAILGELKVERGLDRWLRHGSEGRSRGDEGGKDEFHGGCCFVIVRNSEKRSATHSG